VRGTPCRHLELLHEDSSMSDVQVEVGESVFPAHKVVLAQAPFFQSCISSEIGKSTTSNSSTPCVIKLQVDSRVVDPCFPVCGCIHAVFRHMYVRTFGWLCTRQVHLSVCVCLYAYMMSSLCTPTK
jgi:hypothetical protein